MMLTALQAQLELGDCSDSLHDYRPIACHCLPARMVPTLPCEGVTMHHQSLRGMTASEAKQAFLNLIQSWPLHKATIFDVMVSSMAINISIETLFFLSNPSRRIGRGCCGWPWTRKASICSSTDPETLYALTITAAS